jgi:hypothetical protein
MRVIWGHQEGGRLRQGVEPTAFLHGRWRVKVRWLEALDDFVKA